MRSFQCFASPSKTQVLRDCFTLVTQGTSSGQQRGYRENLRNIFCREQQGDLKQGQREEEEKKKGKLLLMVIVFFYICILLPSYGNSDCYDDGGGGGDVGWWKNN